MESEKPAKSGGPLDAAFDFIDGIFDEARKMRPADPTRRPGEVWVRWRITDAGPNTVQIIGCTEKPLAEPLGEGEHEARFR